MHVKVMSKKMNATESLWYEGVEQLCQLECLNWPKIMTVSLSAPHIEY